MVQAFQEHRLTISQYGPGFNDSNGALIPGGEVEKKLPADF
ncbi:hypothetical protein ACFL2H_00290 [Planctomycetota bacterium]